MTIYRYPTDQVVTSTQNGFTDAADWLGFLCAREYLCDLLVHVHKLSVVDAEARTLEIIPCVRIALGFMQQSLEGPADLAFLPAYYAILNLSKAYVLMGPRHADLAEPKHRNHGASYNPERADSHTVLTESISLRPNGAFALFYETLTGGQIAAKLDLQMDAALSRMPGIGHEYGLAGGVSQLCSLSGGFIRQQAGLRALVTVGQSSPTQNDTELQITSVDRVSCLQGFQPREGVVNQFVGGPLTSQLTTPASIDAAVRVQLKTQLIFRVRNWTITSLGPSQIEFPEEVPIWLLFFYMSSIVRYKPEFLSRLKDTRYWPAISCARLHSFLDFILAFWSFVHQKNYFLEAP